MYRVSWYKNPSDGQFVEMQEQTGEGYVWHSTLGKAYTKAKEVFDANDDIKIAHIYEHGKAAAVEVLKR